MRRVILLVIFIFFLIGALFFLSKPKRVAACATWSGYTYQDGQQYTLCGHIPNGSSGKAGYCIFSGSGCAPLIPKGWVDINSIAGASDGGDCQTASDNGEGDDSKCIVPDPNNKALNTLTTVSSCYSEDDSDNNNGQNENGFMQISYTLPVKTALGTGTDLTGQTIMSGASLHYCSNDCHGSQNHNNLCRCYNDPITLQAMCENDARSNKVCLNPGNKSQYFNSYVNTDGSMGYMCTNCACYNDCNGNFTSDAGKDKCTTGQSNGGNQNGYPNYSGQATPTPFKLPCKQGLDAKGNPSTDSNNIVTCTQFDTGVGTLSTSAQDFVSFVFKLLLGLSGGVCLLLIIFSGYQIGMSQGNPEKVKEAKERLTAAIVGLLFIIFSTAILQIIGINILNIPGFVKFQ